MNDVSNEFEIKYAPTIENAFDEAMRHYYLEDRNTIFTFEGIEVTIVRT